MVTQREAEILGRNQRKGLEKHIRPYCNGNDITAHSRGIYVIDFFDLSETTVQEAYPEAYQWLLDKVKPEREQSRRESYRRLWWIFAEPRKELRDALRGCQRFIATPMTAKHRMFVLLETATLPDQGLVPIAIEDAFFLGVLSSRIHLVWALAAGGTLEDRPRYNKTRCFDPFPFPDPPDDLKAKIRDLGERLDSHRKTVLEKHKQLTMTGLYNVLEKVRAGETMSEAQKDVYDAGLVGVLRQIHDDLDAAVAEAYGWPADLPDEEILERLVALNHERAAEERGGKIRWLRPTFQAPKAAPAAKKAEQIEAELVVEVGAARKPRLPAALPEQVAAVRAMLADAEDAISAADLARRFSQGKRAEKKVEEVLRTLALLGQAEWTDGGYVLNG